MRVYYEDTDAGGVVFYANYLRFMERARTEWLRSLGYEQDVLRARDRVLFAVRRATIEYLSPGRFNDLLSVTCELRRLAGASLEVAQQVLRESDSACCCRASVKLACLDAGTLRPTRLPADLLSELQPRVSARAETLR